MRKILQNKLFTLYLLIAVLTCAPLTACQNITSNNNSTPVTESSVPTTTATTNATKTPDTSTQAILPSKSNLTIHYIDVGQADCILIQNKNKNVLIDAGNQADFPLIQDYLDKLNIKTIDTFILTHPHEDHIGSAAKIVQNYSIGTVYMTNTTSRSRVYTTLIEELKAKKITPLYPEPGDNFSIGKTAFTFVGPVETYDDTNSMSLVVRADFGSKSFLFTGDSTDEAEKDMLAEGVNLQADVLKVGHHGSRDSSTYVFLKAVNPVYSVISVGEGNDYGHPTEEALSRINDVGSTLYRTDQSGTIIATCDGKDITWNTKGTASTQEHTDNGNGLTQNNDKVTYSRSYIGNKNSKVFHSKDCSSLPDKENQKKFRKRQDAIDAGYRPCGKCNP